MLARELRFVEDVNAQLATRMVPGVLQQGDANANRFTVEVYRGKVPAALDGFSVTGYFQRGDSDRVPLEGSIEENRVLVTLDAHCYEVSGSYKAFVRLANAATGEKITVLRMLGYVESEGSGAILDPAGRIPSIEDVIAQLDAMEKATEGVEEAIAIASGAASSAQTWAGNAQTAAEAAAASTTEANRAATRADEAAASIEGLSVTAIGVQFGEGSNAIVRKENGAYEMTLYLEQGPRGETGHGLDIKGTYASVEALAAAQTNPWQGDMYNVGTAPPYAIYMWQDAAKQWEYQGEMQGPTGETGARFTPVITETADAVTLSWQNNGGLTNPDPVNIKGKTPVAGVDYYTPDEKAQFVLDVLAALPNAAGVSF